MPSEGRMVHLKAYDFIKVFEIVAVDDDIEYWATDVLEIDEHKRERKDGKVFLED
jgi:putative transposase